MTLPYQIQRTKVSDHGDIAHYRYDLLNVATSAVLLQVFSRSAIAPEWLRKRRWKLNEMHAWKAIEFNEFRED